MLTSTLLTLAGIALTLVGRVVDAKQQEAVIREEVEKQLLSEKSEKKEDEEES